MNPLSLSRSTSPSMTAAEAASLRAMQTQQRVTDYPYYSSVCFRADYELDETEGGIVGWHYTWHRGEVRRAFAYGRGEEGTIGGFTTAVDGRMTLAETNLVKGNETIGGQRVELNGIAIFVKPAMTDGLRFIQGRLLAQIATNVSIQISVNGDENLFPIGTLQQVPCAGGLVGTVNDDLSFIPTLTALGGVELNIGAPMPFGSNGWATRGNFYRLPSGVIWHPAGEADSMLNVIFTNEREFAVYTGGTPDREQAQMQQGEVPVPFKPASVGVVLTVQLIATIVGARTRTA
jgi:hypothetical protein